MAEIHEMLSAKLRAKIDAEQGKLDAGTLLKSDKGAIRACEHNAFVLIGAAPQYASLHFDEFLSRMRIDGRDWTDADDLACVRWLQVTHNVPGFRLTQARSGAQSVAYERRRDSLREFVEGLPAWDGIERIAAAFGTAWGAPDSDLMAAASRNFFVALIARAMSPAAQVDTVWCFEAPQGAGKSRALRTLGGHFHAEITAPLGSADFMRELIGLWIAELAELDSLRGREASTVKRLLSAPSDRFVQKYALHAETYKRRAVATATTNEARYWEDSSGARRLIPIPCGAIRCDLIAETRLQWFAEALHAYRAEATWWEFPTGISDAQEDRQQVDSWEDALRACILHGRPAGIDGMGRVPWPDDWVSSAEIMEKWLRLPPAQQGKVSSTRLGKIMRRLGFGPKKYRGERGWTPVQATNDGVSSEVST